MPLIRVKPEPNCPKCGAPMKLRRPKHGDECKNEMKPITYISNQPADYAKALTDCHNFVELVGLTNLYREIAPDAFEAVQGGLGNSEAFWREFAGGLSIERRGKYAGDEWSDKYAMIVMPEIMMRVSLIAAHFGAPFGTAFIRCKEQGMLVKGRGERHYRWVEPVQSVDAEA